MPCAASTWTNRASWRLSRNDSTEDAYALLDQNRLAVLWEPGAAAAAFAFAAVWDRVRYGVTSPFTCGCRPATAGSGPGFLPGRPSGFMAAMLAGARGRSGRSDASGRRRRSPGLEAQMDLTPDPLLLLLAVVLDGAVGDPVYALHPIRLAGAALSRIEAVLRRLRLDGYFGGCLLFAGLSFLCLGVVVTAAWALGQVSPVLVSVFHLYVLYSLLALGGPVQARTEHRPRRQRPRSGCGAAGGGQAGCQGYRPGGRGCVPPGRNGKPGRKRGGRIYIASLLVRPFWDYLVSSCSR